jgi:glycosyltransferase involved in cell wall biosynthesis
MNVSVITVCFNANHVIASCLESVACQNYRDIEHIIIDGGSTDGTLETIRRFPHVATLVSEPDRGIYDAMNKGISRATGEFLIFLNADDLLVSPDALEVAMSEVERFPEVDVAYGSLNVREQDGSSHLFQPPAPEMAAEFMVCGSLPHQSTLARRWVFEKTHGFDERYKIHADYDWFLKVLADPDIKVRRIDCAIGSYFLGGISTNLAVGEPEVFRMQNSCALYASPEWDKRRIEIFQARTLELRIEVARLHAKNASRAAFPHLISCLFSPLFRRCRGKCGQ